MVIGTERTSWFSNHPVTCTCTECVEKRLAQSRFERCQVAVRLAEMSVVHAEAGKNLKNVMDKKLTIHRLNVHS